MSSDPSTQIVQTLYEKAVVAGLRKLTVSANIDYLVNYQRKGRQSRSYGSVSCKGSDNQVNAFKASLEGTESENLEIQVQGPEEGDDCPEIKVWTTATGEEKTFSWAQDDPKVYLLVFWATWSVRDQDTINQMQRMLSNNPYLQEHAEIIAISLDSGKEAPQRRIDDMGWTQLRSYWAGDGGFGAPAPSIFKIYGIPTYLLVKKGKIVWRAQSIQRYLEGDMERLVTNDGLPHEEEEKRAAAETRVLEGDELQQTLQLTETMLNAFADANPSSTSPFLTYLVKTEKTENGIEKSSRVTAGGFYLQQSRGAIKQVIEQLNATFIGIENRFDFIERMPEIARGDKCSLCNKVLTEADVQYLCPYCEPKHCHCQACEDLPREGVGSAKLAHPHKLYKITPHSSHFDELLFGPNTSIDEIMTEDPTDRVHGYVCDNHNSPGGCSGIVEGARFKCAHCKFFDLCETCEKRFWDTAPEEWKTIMKRMGHQEYHVLLKIPFP